MPAVQTARPPIAPGVQAAYPDEVLDALHFRLAQYAQLADKTVEWLAEPADRVPVEGSDQVIGIALRDITPRKVTGAGTFGWPVEYGVAVCLWTRYAGSQTGNHRAWLRRHLSVLVPAWTALVGKMLFASYDPATGRVTGRCLTTAPVAPLEQTPMKVQFRTDFGLTVMNFRVPSVLPIDRLTQVG